MKPHKIWLDDQIPPPDDSWYWHKEILFVFQFTRNGVVDEISLDHDLGDGIPTGYDLLVMLEKHAAEGGFSKAPKFTIHSANPVGRQNMERAIASIERFCKEWQEKRENA